MVSRRRFLVLAGSAGVVGAAAVAAPTLLAGEDAEGERLPRLRYSEESCARCGMLIDDVRFAAAWLVPREEVHFDDIGCLVLEAAERPAPAEARYYVTNYEDGAWIEAIGASYVLSGQIRSPMAYGVAATPRQADAERIAHDLGGATAAWHGLAAHLERDQHPEPVHSGQEHSRQAHPGQEHH